jgi:hypothetical protein
LPQSASRILLALDCADDAAGSGGRLALASGAIGATGPLVFARHPRKTVR